MFTRVRVRVRGYGICVSPCLCVCVCVQGKSSVLLATAGCVLLLMVLAPVLFYMSTSTSQPQSLRDRVSSRHLNKQGAEDQDRPAAAAAIVVRHVYSRPSAGAPRFTCCWVVCAARQPP